MHPALLNVDILTSIFWQASPPYPEDDEEWIKNDAAAKSARVCQAFREPALQVLWARLPSLFPLLKLLAPSFGRIEGYHKIRQSWGTTRYDAYTLYDLPDPGQWARFCQYAARVRILIHHGAHNVHAPFDDQYAVFRPDSSANDHQRTGGDSDSDNDDVDPDFLYPTHILPCVWFHLRQLAEDRPLLPALRELVWMTSPFDTELLDLVCPTLQRIHIRLNPLYSHTDEEWSAHLPLFVRSVASAAPAFRRFELGAIHSNTLRAVMPELHNMTHLRYLAIDSLSSPERDMSVQALCDARLDTLKELEYLRIGLAAEEDDPLAEFSPISLPSLRSLAVTDHSWNPRAYELFDAPSLRTLDVDFQFLPISDTLRYRTLCAAFVRLFPNIVSMSLGLNGTHYRRRGSPMLVDLMHVIEPLRSLSALRTLSISVEDATIDVSSADIRAILESWPHLSSLTVDISALASYGKAKLPVDALADVARLGMELTEFRLSDLWIDAAGLERALHCADASPSGASVVVLVVGSVGKATRVDLEKCAALVHTLFPNLDPKRCRESIPDSYHREPADGWNAVLTEVERLRRPMDTSMSVCD